MLTSRVWISLLHLWDKCVSAADRRSRTKAAFGCRPPLLCAEASWVFSLYRSDVWSVCIPNIDVFAPRHQPKRYSSNLWPCRREIGEAQFTAAPRYLLGPETQTSEGVWDVQHFVLRCWMYLTEFTSISWLNEASTLETSCWAWAGSAESRRMFHNTRSHWFITSLTFDGVYSWN